MDSMRCWDCLLKHIAGAVSYTKEVMSGHARGNELDHRVDLLGELVNAEHHAEVLDLELFNRITNLRRTLQSNHVKVSGATTDDLRQLYVEIENKQSIEETAAGQVPPAPIGNNIPTAVKTTPTGGSAFIRSANVMYQAALDVVYEKVTNLDYFKFSYYSIKRWLTNYRNIYVLKSFVDLSEFGEVRVANKSLLEFCKDAELSEDFLYVKEDQGWVGRDDARKAQPMFMTNYNDDNTKAREEARKHGIETGSRYFDNLRPQPVNKTKYLDTMSEFGELNYPMTMYYTKRASEYNIISRYDLLAVIDRPVCCSTKSKLRNGLWARWTNEANFESMKQFLKQQNLLPLPVVTSAPTVTATLNGRPTTLLPRNSSQTAAAKPEPTPEQAAEERAKMSLTVEEAIKRYPHLKERFEKQQLPPEVLKHLRITVPSSATAVESSEAPVASEAPAESSAAPTESSEIPASSSEAPAKE